MEQQGQVQAPAPLEEKTLRELNEMDPYDFAVRYKFFVLFSPLFTTDVVALLD